ncbi:calcineurin-binding protein cabin-1-like isoform X2 [Anneissia japonica]|uniref:calcineurin-binding protein cabin-1-like isoform X2 n=1 Tax=Anneissia japonica TaxID=1529436 RepID=UPI00142596DE|nr:calcineurin-binding protein cabin-1-like isoform X2 [Anneissia japonica]
MIHIAALNDYSDDESETEPVIETTKEAQEAEAYALYNKALELQRGSLHQEAEVHYKRLLNTSLLTKAVASEDGKTEQILVQPGFMLKYSTYKNLASLASQKNDKKTAMEFYLEAVNIDSTDVSLWYKIGHLALELVHVPLARIAFEEAYQCNPKHWPSLDNLCTVLYALYDYPSCLYYIAKCFELDACYPKGHVLRKKIFSEQPALERDTLALFEQCNEWISDSNFISEDQSQKFVEEALDLRKTREQLSKKPAPILVKFQKPLKAFTWKCLGECLVSLYDYLDGSQRPLSFSCQVDLAGCLRKNDDEVMDTEPVVEQPQQKEEAPKDGVTDKVNLCHHQNDELSTAFPIDESVPASSSVLTSTLSSTQDTQGESQTIPMETDHDYAGSIINIEKNKRGPKRKRGLGDEPAPGKRRSARVRNTTTKKKEETINYQTLLQGFLPSSLRNVDDIDESSQDSCIASEENRSSTIESMTVSSPDIQQRKISWKASEESEVREFLEMCVDNNSGVIDMMSRYLINLSRRWSFKWPSGLASVFISCYEKFRKHLQLPSVFNNDSSAECLCDTGNMVLLYAELKLDQWIEKTSNLPTTITPKRIQTCTSSELLPSDLGHEFPAQFYHQDVTFTEQIATLPDVLSDKYEEYTIRVYWAKARLLVLDGKMECALESFDLCSELLTPQYKDNSSAGPVVVVLPNCNHDDTISLEQICKKKESLQRTQSLEEVRRLFDAGEYKKVSSILLPSLKQPLMKSKSICEQKSSERPSQILLLLQSLLKQQEYQECLSCAEIALIETIYEINHATNITSKEEWIEGVVQVCIAIDKTFASDKSIIKKLETGRLVRLTSNLIRIIEIAMETPEVGEFGQVSTVYPWILLYKLIKHEEDQIESMKIDTSDSTSESNRPCLPSSLMLLLTAHEYLGRRSWCCNDKGVFLKLHVSVLEEELFNRPEKDAHPFQSDLEHALEQSFYCLYSHPNRKAKAKHLVDHGVDELPLLWEDTKFLFEYFKPKILPEFDSYKTSTMSSELESLLLKISRIIPEQQNPANTIESLQAFIDGTTDVVPCIPPNKPVKLHVVQELYYLLADYNFKNKEWGKAIKFYLHDLCVNPERFDSWAGMAMARSTRLELKINSCDSKSEGTIYKQASTAARCFERALEIDASNSTLWMEYGSLSYMMQAYSSRKLKQLHEQGTISAETEEFLTTKKCELLKQAKKCYLRASECEGDGEEEEWLVYYMLGKIAEKEHALPQVYLDYYEKAARSLHENEARYPKKITYHNPADLALESLEIYFRIHTSVLKLLEFPDKSNIIDYKLLKKYISEARQFPFARGLEKKAEGRDYSTSDPDTDGKPVNPKTYNYQSSAGSQNSIQQLMDHNYFETSKRVSRTASQESTDTASDLDFFSSGDEPISPRPTDILLFHGGIRSAKPADVFHLLTDEKKSSLYKERFLEKTSEAVKSDVHGSTEKQIEQFAKTETSFKNPVVESSMGEEAIRDSSIVELYEESNSKRIISDESANDTNIISEGNLKDETAAFPKELAPRTIMDATVMAKDPSEMAMDKESADDTMNLEGNLKERIADMVFSSDAVIECVDNARNTAATAFKETTVSSKEFVPEMDTTVMSKETSETAMETDVVSKKFTTMFEEPLPSHSGISGISMEANIMDTVKTVGSNSVHDSEEENNLINSAMDQGNSVKDVVAMDTEKQTTNSDAHSTCAMQSDWQNDRWSRDTLLGTSTPWNQIPHLAAPALFADANKTKNFFQGIWRIPVEEIDRSGSFPSHMYRAISLLISVLLQLNDHQMLLQLSVKLNRTPELNKKYLRDQDRQFLSKQSYEKCLVVLKDLIELCQSGPKEEQQKVLMFVYHANQVRQNKLQITAKSTNNLLIEAFCNFKECKVDNMPCVLEQAVRYCTSIECSKPPQTPHTPSIQSKATKDSSKYDVVPTSKNSDATPTTSKNNDIPTTSKDSDGTPTTSRISDLILNTIRKTVTDDANPLRGMTATTFADQFKHFATSFSARKEVTTTKATKRVLNLGHETKESKKPLLQVLSDEEPEATILDQRRSDESKLNTKDTSISLKGIKEKTHAIVKASISLSRQEPLIKDSLAFSSHVADPVTKQVSSTTLESVPKAVPIKTSPPKGTGSSNVSGIISSFSKANAVAYSMSTSPPKGSAGSGLMIPFSRIALGASQQIKVSSSSSICCSSSSSSCSGSIQSDASKSNQGLSGIHAKVLPYMSTEEKEKLKSSLLHLKKN